MSKKTEPWKVEKIKKLVADGVLYTDIVERLNVSRDIIADVMREQKTGRRIA